MIGSNLVLANREARLRAPSGEDLSGGNAWTALRAANKKIGQFSESQIVVHSIGIEPILPAPQADVLSIERRVLKGKCVHYK